MLIRKLAATVVTLASAAAALAVAYQVVRVLNGEIGSYAVELLQALTTSVAERLALPPKAAEGVVADLLADAQALLMMLTSAALWVAAAGITWFTGSTVGAMIDQERATALPVSRTQQVLRHSA